MNSVPKQNLSTTRKKNRKIPECKIRKQKIKPCNNLWNLELGMMFTGLIKKKEDSSSPRVDLDYADEEKENIKSCSSLLGKEYVTENKNRDTEALKVKHQNIETLFNQSDLEIGATVEISDENRVQKNYEVSIIILPPRTNLSTTSALHQQENKCSRVNNTNSVPIVPPRDVDLSYQKFQFVQNQLRNMGDLVTISAVKPVSVIVIPDTQYLNKNKRGRNPMIV